MRKILPLFSLLLLALVPARELKYISVIESVLDGDRMGADVVSVGDVNGDGYTDMLVCAEGSYSTADYPGKAYLYLGGISFNEEPTLVLTGEKPADHFGVSATGLGDINGDGFDDFAVAADRNDEAGTDAGKVYIYLGGKTLDGEADIVLFGARSNNWFGNSISGGQDVNNDGVPDLLVGAPYGGRKYGGVVNLYLGGKDWKTPALVLSGETAGDSYGSEVRMLGDVNGDGVSDFAVSAVYASTESANHSGIVYIYAGGSVVSSNPIAKLTGKLPREQLGYSICSQIDITGDGVNDIVVGAPGGGPGGMGAAYVFSGGQVVRNEPALKYFGQHRNDLFGISISPAGDFNGDGFTDVMIGAPYTDAGSYHAGRVEIYPGGKNASNERIFHLNGSTEEDQCGFNVSYIPGFFGKGKGLYAITCAGAGSGNIGKSRILLYR